MNSAVLYLDFGREPFWNMTFDEVMFERALNEHLPLQLRLYTWRPGAVTFGFNQTIDRALDLDHLGTTNLIRRITGGRAIYHDESELTYSVAVNTGSAPRLLAQSLHHSSAVISELLRDFVKAAGCNDATIAHKSSGLRPQSVRNQSAPCFESVARHELLKNNRKIVASAQRRIGPAYIQHGSIKLNGIAAHPALPLKEISINQAATLNPLSAMQFEKLAEFFSQVTASYLKLDIVKSVPDSGLCDAIAKRSEYIKKNAVSKRDFFEQPIRAKSL
jgi:lipoate-protein ligase A